MHPLEEIPYRITFGILWLVYFGVRIFYQRRVQKGGPREYTHVNKKRELMLFQIYALATLLLVIYFLTPWIDFAHLPLPVGLRIAGGVVTFLGTLLFGWSHQALGKNWTAIPALSEQHTLVESGPYCWIRHPMYTAFFLIGIGWFLLSANWLIGIFALVPLTLMYALRVGAEERMMLERFGEAYRLHMQRTGRLLPRFIKAK